MAYELSGAKWGADSYGSSGGTVTWSVDFGGLLDFDAAAFDIADFDAALEAAFADWAEVADIDFERVADADASMMDIGMDALEGGTVGYATTSFYVMPGVDIYSSADIVFDSTESWAPYGDGALDFYAVALHEIGHAIGLGHVSDTHQIMNPVVSAHGLGDGDIAGVREIYGEAEVTGSIGSPDDGAADDGTAPPASGVVGPAPDGGDSDGGGFNPLGWLFDLLASIFGGGKDDDTAVAAVEMGTHGHGVTLASLMTSDADLDAFLAEIAHDCHHDETAPHMDDEDHGFVEEAFATC